MFDTVLLFFNTHLYTGTNDLYHCPPEFSTFAQMNSIRSIFVGYCLLAAFAVQSQGRPNIKTPIPRNGLQGNFSPNSQFQGSFQDQDSLFGRRSKQKFTEKKPITDYLIISQNRDTTFVDTTLSIAKQYKFNFRRKDDFEHLAFRQLGTNRQSSVFAIGSPIDFTNVWFSFQKSSNVSVP